MKKLRSVVSTIYIIIFGKFYLYIIGAILGLLCFIILIAGSGFYLYKNNDKLNTIKAGIFGK